MKILRSAITCWTAVLVFALQGAICTAQSSVASPLMGDDLATAPPTRGDATPRQSSLTQMHFTDVTQQSGIDLKMTCGRTPSQEIIEVNGGGLALIDYDNDGDLDLFVANGATMDQPDRGPGCRLYANVGNFRFMDVTTAAGITLNRWAMGVAVGDYDGDRLDDLYVTCFGPNALLKNLGNGRFVDVTEQAGVGDPRWGTGCAFGDVDGDGDLDLYAVNYLDFDCKNPPPRSPARSYKGVLVMRGPHGLTAQHDVLYENLGDGTFRDATATAGCLPPKPAYGLGVVILDFDGDGRQDILVGNDSKENFLFRNRGDLRFEQAGMLSGIAYNADGAEQATMGIAVADVNGNSRPDVFSTNFSSQTNTLHLNVDGRFFADRTAQFGLGLISRPFLGWGTGFYDFDTDGDQDLFIANGHVYPEAAQHDIDSDYEQPILLFERIGKRFARVTTTAVGEAIHKPRRGRAAAFGDLDNDGDIDVVLATLGGPVKLLRNDAPAGDWLIVELDDDRPTSHNHRALGSRIELLDSDSKQIRWIHGGGSFQASSAMYAHFGAVRSNAKLRITWPDGGVQRVNQVSARQHLVVRRSSMAAPEGTNIPTPD